MAGGYIGGGDWISAPLFIVPLTSLTTDPRFAPEANIGSTVQCDDGNQYHCDGKAWRLNLTGGAVDGITVVRDTELFLEEFATEDLPSAALNDRRMLLNGDTNLPVISDRSAWRSLVDEARSAEIAQDVLADVQRIVSEPTVVTVGPTGDYPTLNAALRWAAAFVPSYDGQTQSLIEVRIQSGVVLTEQVLATGVKLSHVVITSVDSVVQVDTSGFLNLNDVLFTTFLSSVQPFMFFWDSEAPRIGARFSAVVAGRVARSYGVVYLSSRGLFLFREDGLRDKQGFENFYVNVYATGASDVIISHATLGAAESINILCGGLSSISLGNSVVRGGAAPLYNISVSNGAKFVTSDADIRRVEGVDGADIRTGLGGYALISENVLGGYEAQPNSLTKDGIIFDLRSAAPPNVAGFIVPAAFTVATLPSAAANAWSLIRVTDGDDGSPCLALSDTSNWLRIALGAAVASS